MNKVESYIENNWDKCTNENMQDVGNLIGVPYPYSIPAVGHFDEMYYWDTYFTNKGLELCGRWAQAKNNTDNILYLVNKYGYMPNGNRTFYLKNSQPPFLSIMVRDVFDHYKDTVWLSGAYEALLKEYDFWQTKRMTVVGLNCYGGVVEETEADSMAEYWKERTGFMPKDTAVNVARQTRLSCESGWDFNPRWGTEGYNFAPVDLNSLMYMFEKNMEYFAEVLQKGDADQWAEKAERRKAIMKKNMSAEGVMLDYNFESDTKSDILSAASFYPLFAGIVDKAEAQALVQNMDRLETEYGILTCEKNDAIGSYQWDYPNGWACLQYITIVGLDKFGFKAEAKRIAEKYVMLVEKVFEETGNLWEKYNVVEGNINVTNEYEMPAMMGWSAGAYLAAKNYLSE